MILSRFFKPKWQHANPEIRKQAVSSLEDRAILSEIALADREPAVRRLACKKITDLEILSRVVECDEDAGVRDYVAARQRRLLLGMEDGSPPLRQRLEHLAVSEASALIEQVALEGKEPELRRKALEKLTNPEVLADAAVRDSSAPIRLAAVERLDDRVALERVLREIGKKDKNVYRCARTRLKEIAEREVAPKRLRAIRERICERIEKLGLGQTLSQDKAVLDHLDKQWQDLGSPLEADIEERYRRARQEFLSAYDVYRAQDLGRAQAEDLRLQRKREKQALLERMRSAVAGGSESRLEEAVQEIPVSWSALEQPAEPDTEEQSLENEISELLGQAQAQLKKIKQRSAQEARLTDLIEKVDTLLKGSGFLDSKKVHEIEQEAKKFTAQLGRTPKTIKLENGIAALLERLEKQKDRAHEKQEGLATLLQEMEQALEAGALKNATTIRQKLQQDIDLIVLSGVSGKKLNKAEQKLHDLLPRMVELQNWRKWSANQHRESLCQSMEALLESDLSLEALAFRLQEMQNEWKELDKGGAPGNRGIWKRFHSASDKVFERCRPHFEEQSRRREENRVQREALCHELETFLEKIDWSNINWKKAVRAEREMRQTWRELGAVDLRTRRKLDKRFRKAMHRLDKHLTAERVRNQADKSRLIEQATALSDEPNIDTAVREAKRLQRLWQTTVPGKRSQENALWRTFREACDQVFDRLNEQKQARRQTLAANEQVRLDLCREAEVLIASEVEGLNEFQQRFHQLEQRWVDAVSLEIGRKSEPEVERRWRQAVEKYRTRLREIEWAQSRAQVSLLRERAQICSELERYIETPEKAAQALVELQSRWDGLPALDSLDLQDKIENRFQQIRVSLEKGGGLLEALRQSTDDNRKKREALCLHMEIMAGIDSPAETVQQRMAVQVDRLSERMQKGMVQDRDDAIELEQQWYLLGPVHENIREGLEQRFRRAVEAVSK